MKKLINLIALVMLVNINVLTPFSYVKGDFETTGTIEYNKEGEYIELRYNNQKIRIRDKNVGATKVTMNVYDLALEYYENIRYNPCRIVPIKNITEDGKYYEAEFLARAQELLGLSEPLTCEDVEEIVEFYKSEIYNPYEDTGYLASFGNYYYRGNNTGAKREDLNVDLDNMEVNINPEIIEKGFDRGKIREKNTGWEYGDRDNPCDADKGEYLPTPDDWKKLMKIRGRVKGYELIGDSFGESKIMLKFAKDMRIPNAGFITNHTTFNIGGFLWTAMNDGELGFLDFKKNLSILMPSNSDEEFVNGMIMPVRCFLYIDPLTVNFYSGNDIIKTIKVEKGEKVNGIDVPVRDRYIYRWNTISGEEWDLEKPLTSDVDLYLEWYECEEGYEVVKNQCVIKESVGVKHEDGLIKVSDGKDTVYLKDRNEGNIDDETLDDFKFELSVLFVLHSPREFLEQCNDNDECFDEKVLAYIEEKSGKHFDSMEGVQEYFYNLEEKYGDEIMGKVIGNLYFRGNNTGVSIDELVIENGVIKNKDELIQKGFDGGKFGNIDGSGWIEGNYNSPCDWSKGEYLPTPDDWKNLFGVWANIYGYEVSDNLGGNIFINNVFVEGFDDEIEILKFVVDTLMMTPGSITYSGDEMKVQDGASELWNGYSKSGEVGVTIMSNFLGIEYFNPENLPGEMLTYLNSMAMPVRCFVKVPVVKFETKGGSPIDDMEVFKGDKIIIKEQPTKSNSIFDGRYKDGGLTEKWDIENDLVEDDMILYAKWIENKPSGDSGGGGGGGGGSSKDDISKDSEKSSEQSTGSQVDSLAEPQSDRNTKNVIQSKTEGSEESSNTPMNSSDKSSEGQTYTKEQKEAYEFAKEKGITTMSTIQKAKMNSPLTRIAMAKMLSQYAINVLGKTPDIFKGTIKFNDVTNKMDKDYNNGVTLAYQLGIMGINMPNNNFRPNDEVTRAEFVTALSRMLYNTSDGEYTKTSKYYTYHMEKLESEGIVINTNPTMKEKRGYVMIMLMRSAK